MERNQKQIKQLVYHDFKWWTKVLVTLTFLQNYSWKTIEAIIMKIVPNDSKLVFVINILTVVYFLYQPIVLAQSCHFFSMTLKLTLASLEK